MDTTHDIAIDLPTLIDLVSEVVKMDPIDYGNLAVDENKLRETCCLASLNMLAAANGFSAEDSIYVLMTSLAKLLEENVVLHAHNLKQGEQIQNSLVKQILDRAGKK